MDTLTISVIGTAYGTSLALVLSRRAWRDRSQADAMLAATLTSGIVALAAILLSHRSGGTLALWLERIEYSATLLSGPALLFWLRLLGGTRSLRPLDAAHALPAAAALVLPPFGGAPMLGIPIVFVVLHQMSYTAAAATVWIRHRAGIGRIDVLLSGGLIALMLSIHGGQIVRLNRAGGGDLIPLLFGLAAIGLTFFAMPPVLLRTRRARARQSKPAAPHEGETVRRLEELMRLDKPYRRTDLTLHDLARLAGVAPHEMTRLLNEVIGRSFHQYLTDHRAREACERLADPANDVYTIDAIAEASGFHSRSSFYGSFRRLTGCSPGEYRVRTRTKGSEPDAR